MPKNTFESLHSPRRETPTPHPTTPRNPIVPPSSEPTGEAYSARFSEMSVANDELYDRRQKPKPSTDPKEKPEFSQKETLYTQMALSEENSLEKAIEKWKHDKAEEFLFDKGILKRDPSGTIVLTPSGKEKLANKGFANWNDEGKRGTSPTWCFSNKIIEKYGLSPSQEIVRLGSLDLLSYLSECRVMDAEYPDQPLLSVTKIPSSLSEILEGKFSGVHFKPWEMPIGTTAWTEPIVLSDGSTSNMAELAVADALQKIHASRDTSGTLLVDHPKTGERVPINTGILNEYLPKISSGSEGLFARTAEFIQNYFHGLTKLRILTPSDVRVMNNTFTKDSIVAPSDRRISGTHASLVTPEGKSLKYYLGQAKIVGTDIPLDRSNTVVRYLDRTTCAYIQTKNGGEEILATFPLLSPEEVEVRRQETRKRLEKSGKSIQENEIAGRTFLNGPEMTDRVRPYRVSDFAPQFPGESAKEYADRIAKLSDARLVSKTTREFFQHYNIGLHQLPWAEQLAASSILIDPRFSKEEIGAFCEQFGIDGLRTFISSTYGKNINRDILALGEKAPELAERTFKKYSEVLAMVDEAESSLRSFGIAEKLDADKREQSIRDIKGQLTQKAKAVLEKIATSVQQTKNLSKETLAALEAELSSSQGDTLLYLNTFKVLKENGTLQSLSEAEKFQLEMLRGGEVPPTLQKQMLDLYDKNYPLGKNYSKRFRDEIFASLKKAFDNLNTTFHTVTRDGQLDAYLRFDRQGKDGTGREQIYFGSFNVGPKGARVGETFLDECLKQESSDAVINASADPTLPISSHYIERNGFVGTGIEILADKPLIKIKRDSRLNERLITKGTASLANDPVIRRRVERGDIVHTKGRSGEMPDFSPLEKGFILTRFLLSKDGTTTCVFEKPSQSSEET